MTKKAPKKKQTDHAHPSTAVEVDLPTGYRGKLEPAADGHGFIGRVYKAEEDKKGKQTWRVKLYETKPCQEHQAAEATIRKWVTDYEAHLAAREALKAKLRGEALPRLETIENRIAAIRADKSELSSQIKTLEKERGEIIREANHPQLDFLFEGLEAKEKKGEKSKKDKGADGAVATLPVDWEGLKAADAIDAIAACSDLETLQTWGDIEDARKKPRPSVLDAIDERCIDLRAAAPHPGIDPSKVQWPEDQQSAT